MYADTLHLSPNLFEGQGLHFYLIKLTVCAYKMPFHCLVADLYHWLWSYMLFEWFTSEIRLRFHWNHLETYFLVVDGVLLHEDVVFYTNTLKVQVFENFPGGPINSKSCLWNLVQKLWRRGWGWTGGAVEEGALEAELRQRRGLRGLSQERE